MTTLEELLQMPEMALIAKDHRPLVQKLLEMLITGSNTGIDGCIDLVRKWGEVKQITGQEDFKLLLEFMEKSKGSIA